LPFRDELKQKFWNIIMSEEKHEYFVIAAPRKTVLKLDRFDLYFNQQISDEDVVKYFNEAYNIYTHDPIDDPVLRGSCSEFKTRLKIEHAQLKGMKLPEVIERYGNTLVIVASQESRDKVLIPCNIGRESVLSNYDYCILERIGRARYFGESTTGKFSLNDFIKDNKLMHYLRSNLMKNGLVLRQNMNQKIRGKVISTQIYHLPRYFTIFRTSNLIHLEKLIQLLKDKPNNVATNEEVHENINVSKKLYGQLIRSRADIFEHGKFPYRDFFPNATKEEYALKNNQEKKIFGVKLLDPNYNVNLLFNEESNEKDECCEDVEEYLNYSNQYVKMPLIHQVIRKIEETECDGMSQTEVGNYFGVTKLNSRSVLRKVQHMKAITFYMKDIGRQRISK
jgi:general transcription factor 3C polypeptide 1